MIIHIKKHNYLSYILRAFAGSVILILGLGVTIAVSAVLSRSFELFEIKKIYGLSSYLSGADNFFSIVFIFVSSLLYGISRYFFNKSLKIILIKETLIIIISFLFVLISTSYSNEINISSKLSFLSYIFFFVAAVINLQRTKQYNKKIEPMFAFIQLSKWSLIISFISFTALLIININDFQLKAILILPMIILHCFFIIFANSFLHYIFINSYYSNEKS